MSKARQLADLLDSNGDVNTGALDNVPPSNDASALTTGTLDAARIADGSLGTTKITGLATVATSGSATDVSGLSTVATSGAYGDLSGLPATGKVLQVLHTHTGTAYSSSDTSYVTASALDTTITPTSASSKFLIIVELNLSVSSNDYIRGGVRLLENGSTRTDDYQVKVISVGTPLYLTDKAIFTYLSSPNTTANLTYSVQFRREQYQGSYGGSVQINARADSDSRMTVMEIAG